MPAHFSQKSKSIHTMYYSQCLSLMANIFMVGTIKLLTCILKVYTSFKNHNLILWEIYILCCDCINPLLPSHTSDPILSFFSFFFLFPPIIHILCCNYTLAWGLPWNVIHPTRVMSLNKTDSSSPKSYHILIDPQLVHWFLAYLLHSMLVPWWIHAGSMLKFCLACVCPGLAILSQLLNSWAKLSFSVWKSLFPWVHHLWHLEYFSSNFSEDP